MSGIMARKIGMTRVFAEDGRAIPVTVLEAAPNPVVQVKTPETDGYSAVQVGYRQAKESRLSKPMKGHLDKAGAPPVSRLVEFPVPSKEVKAGDSFTVEMFVPGEKVDVTGTTKGKGFQGVVKRHGFSGGDETHGCKSKRVPGSIGQCATPGRVWKNKKMPGQTGNQKRTVKNLEIVRVDAEKNLLVIKGAVPGARNGYLMIRKHVSRGGES
ncbi:MAG TPA: 50S ribosomal protein L3 [Candidatus Sabulitectum sp.]|nr:50S ribosomal protein L3 [Candidatus Sabulitectum sp.]HPF31524.1 50S ribosomal protein L3 [Candidatus Sabulitectum sp.]HPJ27943.1 50S ribosomal protein L3 [Candidatus Sabulitectum sp.]HPR21746.1 50S ribosomal protein L3 [Candidatus Sabulitectum sp.]